MKNKTLVLAVLAAGMTASYATSVKLDGIYDGGDDYANVETVTWFNGHKTSDSIYGDFGTQTYTTTIRWGVAELEGGIMGEEFFFLYVEAPLYAKNMIWGGGLPEIDLTPYRVHHETHHAPGTMNLDFNGATGSEKIVFLNSSGGDEFKADLAGNADNAYSLIDHKDSSDYLLDNGISTEALSLARDTPMAFEFQFALNQDGSSDGEDVVALARNGLEMHLSPERGLVPEPSSALLIGLSSVLFIMRRKR